MATHFHTHSRGQAPAGEPATTPGDEMSSLGPPKVGPSASGREMATEMAAVAARRSESRAGVWRTGMLAAALAATANVLLYTLAQAIGVTFVMPLQLASSAPPTVLPIEMVILGSAGGAAAGTVAFALLGRLFPQYPRLFVNVGLAFLVLSFASPLLLPSTDGATKGALILMHIVAGGTTIGLLNGRARR